jgi:hypothetical protein
MKALIVAKTRQGGGACIGAITETGRSARLIAADRSDERWGLDFEIGDVWDLVAAPPPRLSPVREAMGGDAPYEELHLLRLYRARLKLRGS